MRIINFTTHIFLLLLFSASIILPQATIESEKENILARLQKLNESWNEGSIEDYMNIHLKGDEVKFVHKNGVNSGWENIYNRYKSYYPTKERMGKLKFDIIHLELLSDSAAFMIGKYSVINTEEHTGHFTLLWKKVGGEWYIVVDHSS